MPHRDLIEARLGPARVLVLREVCQSLGIPWETWPAHFPEFVDFGVAVEAAAGSSLTQACDTLDVSLPAWKMRRWRRRTGNNLLTAERSSRPLG